MEKKVASFTYLCAFVLSCFAFSTVSREILRMVVFQKEEFFLNAGKDISHIITGPRSSLGKVLRRIFLRDYTKLPKRTLCPMSTLSGPLVSSVLERNSCEVIGTRD